MLYKGRDVSAVNLVATEMGVSAPKLSHCKPMAENYLVKMKNTLQKKKKQSKKPNAKQLWF